RDRDALLPVRSGPRGRSAGPGANGAHPPSPPVLGADGRQYVGPLEDAIEGPGERRRRRLVAGEEQRHHLITQVVVRHRAAVLVTSRNQQRQHVVARWSARSAPPCDLRREDVVNLAAGPHEPTPWAEGAESATERCAQDVRV